YDRSFEVTRITRRVFAAGGLALALSVATTLGVPRVAEPSPGPDGTSVDEYDETRAGLGGAELSSSSMTTGDDETSSDNECESMSSDEEADAIAPSPISEPFLEPYFPFLNDEAIDASLSVGDTTHGLVVNAQPLQESEACQILP